MQRYRSIFLWLFASLTLVACTSGLVSRASVQSTPTAPAVSLASTTPPSYASPTITGTPLPTPLSTQEDATAPPTLTRTHAPVTPTPLLCWKNGGHIEQNQLSTELLRDPLAVRVYLPPCYTEEPNRRYPALYLVHGQTYNDDQWDRLGADETADALIASGEASPFLIVMPRDRACCDQPDKDKFGQAFMEVLVPWVDQTYRTLPERPYRAIGGLSRGAAWAIHIGLPNWDKFGAIGGHSLPVFWSDTFYIKKWLDSIPSEQMPRFYLDNPNNDRREILDSSLWFESLLTERDIPHEWYRFTGYHEEEYWRSHVEQYLRWYIEGW